MQKYIHLQYSYVLLFSLIILATFYTIFAFFLLCAVSILPWYLIEIYTKFRSGGSNWGFAIISDGYFSAYSITYLTNMTMLLFWIPLQLTDRQCATGVNIKVHK